MNRNQRTRKRSGSGNTYRKQQKQKQQKSRKGGKFRNNSRSRRGGNFFKTAQGMMNPRAAMAKVGPAAAAAKANLGQRVGNIGHTIGKTNLGNLAHSGMQMARGRVVGADSQVCKLQAPCVADIRERLGVLEQQALMPAARGGRRSRRRRSQRRIA